MKMLQLDPLIPLETPKGRAMAHVLIDYGPEHHLLWVCFMDDTGTCWTFRNDQISLQKNETMRPGGQSSALETWEKLVLGRIG